jgi:hypothetical protein
MFAKMLRRREAPDRDPKAPLPDPDGRRAWVLHPFLVGTFPILSLYGHNVYETRPADLVMPLVLVLSGTAVVWLVARLLSRDALRAAMVTSLLVAACFAFGATHQAMDRAWYEFNRRFWVEHATRVHPLFVLAGLIVPVAAGLFAIFRLVKDPRPWTSYLNAFTLLLVALPAGGAVSARMREAAAPLRGGALPGVEGRGWTPDIYFIVLDGYARSDVMKDLFGFDNGPFLDRLEGRGFSIARQATSNYCQTRVSIASTLNADYIDKLIEPGTRDLLPLTELIKDNLVKKLLRPRGYRFVSFATGFEPTDQSEEDDVYLIPRPSTPAFYRMLVEMTPLGALLAEVRLNDRFSEARDRTLYLLDHLPTIARMEEPTFTFAHIVSPHPPFIFGENGEDVSPRRVDYQTGSILPMGQNFGTPEYVRESYRKQSIYITGRVERMIDQILAESPEPPVIVLQSDHGSWLRYHPDDVEATDLRERFGILNAIYVPDGKLEGFTDHSTSVNTFRVVLDSVFGADLPPLPERSYFSPFRNPLGFTDVTERLHSDRERKRQFQPPSFYGGLDIQL